MRQAVATAVVLYAFGAAMTFNFGVPIDCSRYAEFTPCVVDNLKQSAIAGITWPVFWIGRA